MTTATPAQLLAQARAAARLNPTGIAAVTHGRAIVTWSTPTQSYDVGTAARSHATGRRRDVLPVLERLLAPEVTP